MRRLIAGMIALGLCACASTKPTKARREVSEMLAERAGTTDAITPEQDAESRDAVRKRVADLLREPLTEERALQIAMLNNRDLQGVLEELGIAQADLVQAGLLKNPVIAGDLVVSTRGFGLGGGMSLSQSLLSVFLIPAQRRLAKAQLRYAVVSVADAALELSRDVKVAYAEVQAAAAVRDLHKRLVQVAEVGAELAERQHEAGNLPDLDRQRFGAALDEARLRLSDYELELVRAREQLSRLLGLWGKDVGWTLAAPLPDLPGDEIDLAGLEQQGIRDRLDVSAAKVEVDAIALAVKLRRRGIIGDVEAGVTARNEVGDDEGHEWVIGPSLAIELPIFDPGHADLARLRSILRQAEHRLQSRAIAARSEIRVHREELVAARRKVEYFRSSAMPRRATISTRALEQYNAMQIGTYELLETRAEEVDVQHEYVEALLEYWTARAELERAIGGHLPTR